MTIRWPDVLRGAGAWGCIVVLGGCQKPPSACELAGEGARAVLGSSPVVEPVTSVAGAQNGCTWRFETKNGRGSIELVVDRRLNSPDFFELHRRELEASSRTVTSVEGVGDAAIQYQRGFTPQIDWIDGTAFYMLIGNGVPPELMESFAREIAP